MKQSSRFQYTRRDAEVIKQRGNQRGSDYDPLIRDGIKIYKPKEGKNTIRILPPTWERADHYGYDVFVNYGVGLNEGAYISLHDMKKQPDPLAEARRKAERQGDKDVADSLKATKRVGMYVIDRNAEDEGPQLWLAPWTVDRDLCNFSIDEDEGVPLMIDDPEEGNDIRFHKEGTGKTTKYPAGKMKILKPSRLSDDAGLAEEWLQFVSENPIPDTLIYYDYDHIAQVFDGHVRGNDNPKSGAKGKVSTSDAEDNDDDARNVRQRPSLSRPDKNETRPISTRSRDNEEEYDPETGVVKESGPPFDPDEDGEPRSNLSKIRARISGRKS